MSSTLIPRKVLFGNPDWVNPQLSPDGKWLGYSAPDEGVLNLVIEPLDGTGEPRVVTKDRGRGIHLFQFCHDGRHLVYAQDDEGEENWRLYRLELETGEVTPLTPELGVKSQILAHHRWHPELMLVACNIDNPALHDVYRIDLDTGNLTKIETNPGATGGPPFAGWLIDTDLVVRGGLAVTPDGSAVLMLRNQPGQPYEPVLRIPAEDVDVATSGWFDRTGTLWLSSSAGDAQTRRLARLDTGTGELITVAESDHDLHAVGLCPQTLEPRVATFDAAKLAHQPIDPALEADLAAIAVVDDGAAQPIGTTADDTTWLLASAPPHTAGGYYLYHRRTRTVRFLFHANTALADHRLAATEPFEFTARDGLPIRGYVTYPPGRAGGRLPTVLLVHGGPWTRDRWTYNPQVQLLANRGYLVLQVNYRGSVGYGKDFCNAGNKQWGKAMLDDLVDAVDHAVGNNWADPKRVAIVGGSYGGYAAICGAAFTTHFAAAASLCGPVNLHTLISSLPAYAAPTLALFHTRVGHPEHDADLLRSASPLHAVDRIDCPVLVGQGANDVRVTQAEADQIVAALEEHGVPHTYLLYPDEGHGLVRPDNRLSFFGHLETFLAEHLGGASEPFDPQATTTPGRD